jgi:hypothetical protein
MNETATRRTVAPRDRGRVELRRLRARLRELERRLGRFRQVLADRTDRLAERVAVLERWSPFVRVRDGS